MFLPTVKLKIIVAVTTVLLSLLILSIILIVEVLPNVIKHELFKNVQLTPGTEPYDVFLKMPFPLTFKVYFFNVENVDKIYKGEKPIVKEIGPYVYKQFRKKIIYDTNLEEDTISYEQFEKFEFDPEASQNLTERDFVTLMNIPMISALQIAETLGATGLLSSCLSNIFPKIDQIFIKVNVRDALFDGIKFCFKHFSLCEVQQAVVCQMAEQKKNVEKDVSQTNLKFSFFNYKAEKDDGLYTVKRGVQDVGMIGQIVRWNNQTHTTFWPKKNALDVCNQIKGTDSTVYHPQINKNDIFQIYSTDICRSLDIGFTSEEVYKSFKGYTFSTNNSTLQSKTVNKGEDCFCVNQTRGLDGEKTCFLDGLIDTQPCTKAPVLLSWPHFLWAHQTYIDGVTGIFPDEELHKTYVTVEPNTGIPLKGAKRIQINAVLRPIKKIGQTSNLPRTVLPILWMEESFSLPDEYLQKLDKMYFQKVFIVTVVEWTFFGVSLLFSITLLIYLAYKLLKKQ